MSDKLTSANENSKEAPKKPLTEAAKRALAEAAERRNAQSTKNDERPAKEYGGRGGADPSRFGDWEIDGRAIDF